MGIFNTELSFKKKINCPFSNPRTFSFFISCRRMPHSLVQPPMSSVIWSNQPLLHDLLLLCDSLFQPHWSLACSFAHALASNHLPHHSPQPPKIYPHPHLIYHFHSQAGRSKTSFQCGSGWGRGKGVVLSHVIPGLGNMIYLWTMTTVVIITIMTFIIIILTANVVYAHLWARDHKKCLPISWQHNVGLPACLWT